MHYTRLPHRFLRKMVAVASKVPKTAGDAKTTPFSFWTPDLIATISKTLLWAGIARPPKWPFLAKKQPKINSALKERFQRCVIQRTCNSLILCINVCNSMLLRPLQLRLAPALHYRSGFPSPVYVMLPHETWCVTTSVVIDVIKTCVAHKFFHVPEDLKKVPKMAKNTGLNPLFCKNDGLEPGPAQSPKITIFDHFFVPLTCMIKKFYHTQRGVTLHYITLHFLHHTVRIL